MILIRWIANLIHRRIARRRRELFAYFDGRRLRRLDPLQVHIALELHPTFSWEDFEMVRAGHADKTKVYLEAICDIFDVTLYTPDTWFGLTGAECLDILADFMEYCDEVKKNIDPGPTWRQPTAQESSTPVPEESSATMS